MKVSRVHIRNFRRLVDISIEIEDQETIFVGPNNSGKTSATAIFRSFLGTREFRAHDFSLNCVTAIDDFASHADESKLLPIELDIWFSVDPEKIAFARAFSLLPKLSDEYSRLGIRLSYRFVESKKLLNDYDAAYPSIEGKPRNKTLFQFLTIDRNLKKYCGTTYWSLEEITGGEKATELAKDEGKRLMQGLLRVDFVDAQRNIDDEEHSRSNRLSDAFAAYYRRNLEQAESAAEAHKVIDENNLRLSAHYETQFVPLKNTIKGLGVPSINDRDLKIISSLSPETALRGNTELLYVDAARRHELPEQYNGLGFKNLIYMAVQARHYVSQWIRTEVNRPLCQLIFVEEPEVHLHAQVQQSFVANIRSVIQQSVEEGGGKDLVPQLILTTHSSHILEAVGFGNVRYFRRCRLDGDSEAAPILNASEVKSLRAFKPSGMKIDDEEITSAEALEFLKKYIRLAHCDLFFADAAILVEGAAEKLLLPLMMKASPNLRAAYLTVLEVGGAFAHRFQELLLFIGIPYLIITDVDSVEPMGSPSACRADKAGARTSNATLRQLLGVQTVAELLALDLGKKSRADGSRCVVFQTGVNVKEGATAITMQPRTFEEALAYQNFELFRSGELQLGVDIPAELMAAYESIYQRVQSREFKKTDFALSILASSATWKVPGYIAEGLAWLGSRLAPPAGGIEKSVG